MIVLRNVFIARGLALFIFLPLFSVGQKTDTLIHRNGNILKGEIKKIDLGIIYYKMTGMGTIKVQLDKVSSFKSRKYFEVVMESGEVFYGSIDTTNKVGMVRILTTESEVMTSILRIIEVYPIKSNFWSRTSGRFDVGFNYTKASRIARVSYSGNIGYRTRQLYARFAWDGLQTFQDADTTTFLTSRLNLLLTVQKRMREKWYYTAYLGSNENTELGLNLRIYVGAGVVNDFIHTNKNRLFWIAAISPNTESSAENVDTYNVEGQFALNYRYFKYSTPELHLDTDIQFIPSINEWGRYRLNYNLDVSVEVIYNFYVGTQLYYNFDNQPAGEQASTDDWGLTMTVGYSFN
ncbi:MAG TPA: hypothetical protein DDX92_08470 [Flavobacteriales bacterium]|nr:hypothetical protein [Flavobacteriales bacterium]